MSKINIKINPIWLFVSVLTFVIIVGTVTTLIVDEILENNSQAWENVCSEMLTDVHEVWIDHYYGRINITEEQVLKVEELLDGLEGRE